MVHSIILKICLRIWWRSTTSSRAPSIPRQIKNCTFKMFGFWQSLYLHFLWLKTWTVALTSFENCAGCQVRSQMPCNLCFRRPFMTYTIHHRKGADGLLLLPEGVGWGVEVACSKCKGLYPGSSQPELAIGNLHSQRKNRASRNELGVIFVILCDCLPSLTIHQDVFR